MNSMFCIHCYLNVIALYTALELGVMIKHFRLTQIEGILSKDKKMSFSLIFKSSLLLLCMYIFTISRSELYLLHFVSGKLNEYIMLRYDSLFSCVY